MKGKVALRGLARLACGIVFCVAGAAKVLKAEDFSDQVAAYGIFSQVMINPIALILPWWEIVLGSCVLLGWRLKVAAGCIILLLTTFQCLLAVAIIRDLPISCGCAPIALLDLKPKMAFVRNTVLLGASIYLFLTSQNKQTSSEYP
jgi:uncharacterized membrane protein YphA (DoxX/SURF4 family)